MDVAPIAPWLVVAGWRTRQRVEIKYKQRWLEALSVIKRQEESYTELVTTLDPPRPTGDWSLAMKHFDPGTDKSRTNWLAEHRNGSVITINVLLWDKSKRTTHKTDESAVDLRVRLTREAQVLVDELNRLKILP